MSSLEVVTFKQSIKDYIANQSMPKEVIRMALKEIYAEVEREAYEELILEAKEKGDNNANQGNEETQ